MTSPKDSRLMLNEILDPRFLNAMAKGDKSNSIWEQFDFCVNRLKECNIPEILDALSRAVERGEVEAVRKFVEGNTLLSKFREVAMPRQFGLFDQHGPSVQEPEQISAMNPSHPKP